MAIITLTTDFGLADHFVGAMKGVILKLAPRARVVDISHELRAFDIPEAAFVVSEACPWYPRGTVHVVVVDPGVGTARRPILVEAGGQSFLGPDNGVFSLICRREKRHKVRAVTAEKYFLQPVSHTFHGRDIFAPVAARLARGLPAARLGPVIQDSLRLDFARAVRTGKRVWTGTVLKVDRFGNLITNLHLEDFPDLETRTFELSVGAEKITRLSLSYAFGRPGEALAVVGSSGYLEVAVNQGSAARALGCAGGAPVEITVY